MQRICFDSAVALCVLCAWATGEARGAEWGTLRGRFLLDGAPPAVTEFRISKDDPSCAGKTFPSEKLVVRRENGGVANVAVWLSIKRGVLPTPHPSLEAKLKEPVVLDITSCRFTPHMVFVRSGQPFVVRNNDKSDHNFECGFGGVGFFRGDLAAGKEATKVFSGWEDRPGPVISRARSWMSGYILVLDHPYAAVSNSDGEFVIEDLPAGKWVFRLWHEGLGYLNGVTFGDETAVTTRGLVEVVIKPGDNDLGEINLKPEMLQK